jgi:hypothetical protein
MVCVPIFLLPGRQMDEKLKEAFHKIYEGGGEGRTPAEGLC